MLISKHMKHLFSSSRHLMELFRAPGSVRHVQSMHFVCPVYVQLDC